MNFDWDLGLSEALSLSGMAYFYLALNVIGLILAVRAIMIVRTSQGAIAWAISLITFPIISVPLFFLVGRKKFHGYVEARREGILEINYLGKEVAAELKEHYPVQEQNLGDYEVFEELTSLSFTGTNSTNLLIDGQETFKSMFESIRDAKKYVLIQFYIVRDDYLGNSLSDLLREKSKEGVDIYFLYDEVGSHSLGNEYIRDLRKSGVKMVPFVSTTGRSSRWQVNFRNHRKICVIDGEIGFVGGHNIGKEYIGKDEFFGYWRDTHLKIAGPAVLGLQLPFLEDWFWSCKSLPKLVWDVEPGSGSKRILNLPTGPVDDKETCGLFFLHSITHAKDRIWIASPYFIPDSTILQSLILASLRGVDVRILIPSKSDRQLVHFASLGYISRCIENGIKIYRYEKGFMHQKVVLVDDDFSSVGTANLDNRSFRLNFEIMTIIIDREFNNEIEVMLEDDFNHSRMIENCELESASFLHKFLAKVADLFSPIL
ncbi:MAG: cardiolipin synthase [Bacteriovoracaceae bacterium]|nr:cardiolipin synthase [Bacteriovoracaceae bacterium]